MLQLRTALFALGFFACASLSASRASTPAPARFIAGELIIGMRQSGATASQVAQLVGIDGQVEGEQRAIRAFRVRNRGRRSMPQMLERLRRLPGVEYVEPNQVIQAVGTPNDPQWGSQYGPRKMQVDQAWDVYDPQAQIIVAVLDTGIDYDHPDLADMLVRNASGQVLGYNALNGSANADDDQGHGTHCAGTIAARINNATGVAGMAGWNPQIAGSDGYIKLLPVKVLDSGGNGSDASVASGIIWAADRGAKVISLSLGAPIASTTLGNAVNYAANKGCLVVAAAGNNSVSTPFYPAAFSNVLSVGATDSTDTMATFSNWGSWVKVAAPGAFILSTYRGGGYQYMSGTSMACPHVAGLAALLRSQSPGLANSQVINYIVRNVDPYVPYSGRSFGVGAGRANAYRALLASGGGAVLVPSAPTGLQATAGDQRVSLSWNTVAGATGYTVKRSTTSGSGFTAVASGLTAASYTDTNVSNGATYYYVLTASNSAGESAVSAQVSASPSVAAGITPLRIDCGGSGYTSASGQVWTADKHFSGGSTYKYPSRDILGGTDDPLHLSIRLGTSFSYTLPATAGSYTLKLHFAECWFTAAGGRKFNVTVNGSQALSSFDIVAAAGGGNRLTVQEIPVTVTGSSVTVTFQKVLNDALVNAIELIPSGGDESPTPPAAPTGLQAAAGNGQVSLTWNAVAGATSYTVKRSTISGTSYQSVAGEVTSTSYADTNVSNGTTYYYVVAAVNAVGESADSSQVSATPTAPASGGVALRIDSGGKGYTSAAGVAWTADQRFSGGSTYTYPARDILGGTDDPLHLSIRLGRSFSYTLPAAPGAYTLRLHFAECWFTAAGGRKFNVTVNGSPALTNFDVAAAAGGGNRLVVRELPVTVTGASVTVAFQTVLNDALVNAIELIPSDGGGEETPTPPAAPTGLQATAGNGQVSLSWAPSTGAASYTVKRSVAGGASYQTVAGEVTSASYTDTAVNNGTTYQYVVSASNADGESADSTQVSATPTSPGAGTTTLRINCGGAGFTGAGGVVWSADQYGAGGAKYLYPARDIAGTAEDYRYYSVRYSEGAAFSYSLPATAGAYTLKLHFAECWFTTAGGRKFNVNVNGSTVLNSFDVVAAAGSGNTAVVREFPVTAGANGVVVQFQSVLNGPIISGIELIPAP